MNHPKTQEEITRFHPIEYLWKDSERKLMYEVGIPMLRCSKACLLIKYKANLECIHKCIEGVEEYIVDHQIIIVKEQNKIKLPINIGGIVVLHKLGCQNIRCCCEIL